MLKRIHFIGFGLMAASFAAAVKKINSDLYLSAESEDDGPEFGIAEKILNESCSVSSITDHETTLLIIATPMNAYPSVFEKISRAKFSGWISDLGSVKTFPVQLAKQFNLKFFGGHPMAGSEKNTAKNFNPIMFENAVFVLTGKPDVEIAADYVELIKSIGALTLELSNEEHDQIAATISHLPQLLAVSLVDFTRTFNEKQKAYLQLAAGGFRDMTRIASSPSGIWKDILKTNHDHISLRLNQFISYLTELKSDLEKQNPDNVLERFNRSKLTRDSIPRNTKGFLHPLFDLLVFVEDQPGVIFRLSKILFEHNINIRDIELLKVREGHQGAFRVSFSSESALLTAKELMESIGFKTQIIH